MRNAFIGRKHELERLNQLFGKKSASLVVVKGRRRIGKSRLASEFAKNKQFLHFAGLPPTEETTADMQRKIFAQQLSHQLNLPAIVARDWSELFNLLAKQVGTKKTVILLDEISWMGSKDPSFLGELKNAWDIGFSQHAHLVLMLCGSVSTWIDKNIINSTGFFGRISLYLTLEELPLPDCYELLIAHGFKTSRYEIFKFLSVTGGVPWYIEHVNPALTTNDNIRNLCFTKEGILFNEFPLIFHDLFSKRNQLYKTIVMTLSQGALQFNQICEALNYSDSGVLTEYLNDLIQAGFIARDYTWSLNSRKFSKLSRFRLSDNYLRFYIKYINGNEHKILKNNWKALSLESLRGWNTLMGLQFENLVIKNYALLHQQLNLHPEDIINAGPFFQRKTTRSPGCQIDYLIQTRFNTLYLCEIKFSSQAIHTDVLDEVKQKMTRLSRPKGYACLPVLIVVNGVNEAVIESDYFNQIVNFDELLRKPEESLC